MVVNGKRCSLEDRIMTPCPGARVNLIGVRDHTICIMGEGSSILASGIVQMERAEALLRMDARATIRVDVNARLNINDMLLLEEGASLIVEPGAQLEIMGALHIAKGCTVRIATGVTYFHGLNARVDVPLFTVADRAAVIGRYNVKPATWCDQDKRFLVNMIRFFCWDLGIPQDLLFPLVLPIVCQRYGVLMRPGPYYTVPEKSRHRPRFLDGMLPLVSLDEKPKETCRKPNRTK